MVKINYLLLIILTLIIKIDSAQLKKDDELFLVQTEYQYNITKFNVTVLNREDSKINDGLSSRIAFLNNTESDNIIFDLNNEKEKIYKICKDILIEELVKYEK